MIETNADAPTVKAQLHELVDRLTDAMHIPDYVAAALIDYADLIEVVEPLEDDDPVFTLMSALLVSIEERTGEDIGEEDED